MRFEDYIKLKKVRIRAPDEYLAKKIVISVERDKREIEKAKFTEQNASFYFKSIYDCLRACMDALLASQGFKSYSHEADIQFCLERKLIGPATAARFDAYRILRHDIQYRAEDASLEETKEIMQALNDLISKMKGR